MSASSIFMLHHMGGSHFKVYGSDVSGPARTLSCWCRLPSELGQ